MVHPITLMGSTFVAGEFGNAVHGGTGAFAAGAGAAYAVPTSLTIEYWINPPDNSGTDVTVGIGSSFWMGRLAGAASVTTAAGTLSGSVALPASTKTHVAITLAPGGRAIFVGGVKVSPADSNAYSNVEMNADPALFALGIGGGFNFTGSIDELAISSGVKWTTTFTPPTAPYVGNEANLLALYHFEADGTDSVGSGPSNATSYTSSATPTTVAGGGTSTVSFALVGGVTSASGVITPSDGGAGGSFSPTTISVGSGASTVGSTVYTAPSGARSITVSFTHTGLGFSGDPSNITLTDTGPAPATSYTAGASPTTVAGGGTSTVSFALVGGVTSASGVITPSDNSAGGSFSPTTISVGSGASTIGSTTYTAPSGAGSITLSFTHTGLGFSGNPSNITLTDTGPGTVTIPVTSAPFRAADLGFSDGNWDHIPANTVGDVVSSVLTAETAACVQTTATGATLDFGFAGTTQCLFNGRPFWTSGAFRRVRYAVDNNAPVDVDITSSTSQFGPTGLSTGSHRMSLEVVAANITSGGDRFGNGGTSPITSPQDIVRLYSVTLDSGGTLSAPNWLPASSGWWIGDSTTEGVGVLNNGVGGGGDVDSQVTFATMIASGLGLRKTQLGYGGVGVGATGAGNMPVYSGWISSISAGRSRTFVNAPTDVVLVIGNNGGDTPPAFQTLLAAYRSYFGAGTWLHVVTPCNGADATNLTSETAAYITASGDTKVTRIDVSGTVAYLSGNRWSGDGLHQDFYYNGFWSPPVTRAIVAAKVGSGSAGGSFTHSGQRRRGR